MKTAAVTVTAIPSKGERPWETFKVASKQGLATIHVAANRRIRIAVKDWHGRDLGGVYESEREAGTDAVTAEFRIRH
jgi:hypothetical protein